MLCGLLLVHPAVGKREHFLERPRRPRVDLARADARRKREWEGMLFLHRQNARLDPCCDALRRIAGVVEDEDTELVTADTGGDVALSCHRPEHSRDRA